MREDDVMTCRVFISYRRLDSQSDAGRLLTTLQHELGDATVFVDTSTIAPGAEWPVEIQTALHAATTVIILIGPDWLRAGSDEYGQRPIDSPTDWVRQEIELALQQDKHVIPILLRQAKMPPPDVLPPSIRQLTSLQALELRSSYWDHDVKLLVQQLHLRSGPFAAIDRGLALYPPPHVNDVNPYRDLHMIKGEVGLEYDFQINFPPYVRRDVDDDMDRYFERLRQEGKGGFLVLVGPSKCGKSRSAFEALKRNCAEHRLLVPKDPKTLPEILAAYNGFGEISYDDSEAKNQNATEVLWLDDIYRNYFKGNLINPNVLAQLIHRRGLVVIATIWPEELSHIIDTRLEMMGMMELSQSARDVLAHATIMPLDYCMSPGEQQRALAAYANQQHIIAEIKRGEGIGPALVGLNSLVQAFNIGSVE
jgi:TIR domain